MTATATTTILDWALAAHAAGLSVVRVAEDGTKKPLGTWKQYQTTPATEDQLRRWFSGSVTGMGIVTGPVSRVELLEFEGRAVAEGVWDLFLEQVDAAGLGEVIDSVINGFYEVSPSGGIHLLYRCNVIKPNTKLARRPSTLAELEDNPDEPVQVLVETRGDGGFVVTAPSHGNVHPTGLPYVLERGGFDQIATITAEQRDALFAIAETLDQVPDDTDSCTPGASAGELRLPASGDSPFSRFDQQHTCDEILLRNHFTFEHEDQKGRHYTRPGKPTRAGSSATVWADNGTCSLFSTTIDAKAEFIGNRNLKPYQLACALEHGGDFTRFADGLPRTVPAVLTPWTPAGTEPVATETEERPLNLPDRFWAARPELAHIRQAAHARAASADAVLAATLARLAANIPPWHTLPAPVGTAGTLDLCVALIGDSGTGKSIAANISAELIPLSRGRVDSMPLGSGEGLIDAYFAMVTEEDSDGKKRRVKRQELDGILFSLDEGQALAEMSGRKGATLMPTIRSAWSGARLGQANAGEETRRHLAPGSYRFALIAGFQLEHAVSLINDAAGGTPQRMIFAAAIDPTVPEQAPIWPGALPWHLDGHAAGEIPADTEILAEIRQRHLEKVQGRRTINPLDSHRDLSRLKTAALLGLLNNRWNITTEDWDLAGQILDTSDQVRTRIITTAAHHARAAEDARVHRDVRRDAAIEHSAEQRALDSMVRSIANHVHKQTCPDGCRPRCASRATASKHRALVTVAAAITEAHNRHLIEVDGDTLRPGTQRIA